MCCGKGKSSVKGRSRLIKKRVVQNPVLSAIELPKNPTSEPFELKIEKIDVCKAGELKND